jgi:hypothetical protein
MISFRSRILRPAVLSAAALFIASASAQAQQLAAVGSTIDTIPGQPQVRGNDTAHDPTNRVFLQVSAYGPVLGRFVNETGTPVTSTFVISPGTVFGHFPRIAYSPHVFNGAGGFLVTWHQGDGPAIPGAPYSNQVHGRLVRYAANPILGDDVVLGTSPLGSFWEAAPGVAYSAASQQFLVAWQAFKLGQVDAVRVSVGGTPVGAPFTVSDSYARDPSVAWNSIKDEFAVAYGGANASGATVTLARVSNAGAVVRRTILHQSSSSFITDIAFNAATEQYVVAYAAPGTRTTLVSGAGDVISHGLLASSVGTYDGLSIALNPVNGYVALVGHYTTEIGGVLLNAQGAKVGPEQVVTSGGSSNGSFYPRVSASSVGSLWQVSYSRGFAAAAGQVLTVSGGQQVVDTDGDGVPDTADVCPNVAAQTANGCPAAPPPPPPPAGMGDINGDNKSDIVFEHMVSGALYGWFMSNGKIVGESALNPAAISSPDWLLVSKMDFTSDGKVDFLWQKQSTGELMVWQMNGLTRVQEIPIPVDAGPWRVVSTPDLDRDGYPDLVWQNSSDNQLLAWFLQKTGSSVSLKYQGGFVNLAGAPVPAAGAGWRVVTTGDLNSDGYEDLVWQNQTTQAVVAWFLTGANGIHVSGSVSLSTNAGPWRVRMLSDMNHDGKADIVWQNGVTAERLLIWFMNGAGAMAAQNFFDPPVYLPPNWRVVGGR